ncbi:MAG: hypothetical protein GXP02_08950 [Alphaproteobacteria bacterium]|nr:hypothetical protein [Alphaproteobacteria bacterium]
MEIFRDEIFFVLNNTNFKDDRIFNFLKDLSEVIYLNRDVELEYDSVKSFCGFLWGIFACWDWVKGYSESDVIEEMIETI